MDLTLTVIPAKNTNEDDDADDEAARWTGKRSGQNPAILTDGYGHYDTP
jgi:hypothetical protein